jgi:hypothetical protein
MDIENNNKPKTVSINHKTIPGYRNMKYSGANILLKLKNEKKKTVYQFYETLMSKLYGFLNITPYFIHPHKTRERESEEKKS